MTVSSAARSKGSFMPALSSTVILLDCDNTLMDTDSVKRALHAMLIERYGEALKERYVAHYEQVRQELGIVHYGVTIERLRREHKGIDLTTPLLLFLHDYPYQELVFPGVLDLLAEWRQRATLVIVSDGDPFYQRYKIARAGIEAAVGGNVLIFTHKEAHLEEITRAFPAERYLFADDKPRLISAVKGHLGRRVQTIWVQHGSYAAAMPPGFSPDVQVQSLVEAGHLV